MRRYSLSWIKQVLTWKMRHVSSNQNPHYAWDSSLWNQSIPQTKLIHPWEHFIQTRVSPLLLQGACSPVLMRILDTQNPGLLPSLSSPKCWWTLAPHQGKPAPASLHFQVTGDPSSPAFLLGMSGSFVCCWKPINHFKPSAASSQLKGITDGLTKSLLWWRDGRNQSWRSVPGW